MKRILRSTALCTAMVIAAVAASLAPTSQSEAQAGPLQRLFGGGYYNGGYYGRVYNGYSTYGSGPYGYRDYGYRHSNGYAQPVIIGGYGYGYPNAYQRRPVYRGVPNRGYGVSEPYGTNYNPFGYGYYGNDGF